jgi:hypothetical protein
MANIDIPDDKREFRCNHCNGKILIPRNLPPTTGPCPHCSGVITSPAPEDGPPAAFIAPAPVISLPVTSPPPAAPVIPAPVKTQASIPPPPPAPVEPPPVVLPPPRVVEKPAAPTEIPHPGIPPQDKNKKPKAAPAVKEKPRKSGIIPMMLVLLVIILGAGAAVYFVTNEMGRNVPPPTLTAADTDTNAREANYIRVGWQKEAYQLLRDYMAATSSSEKLPFIINGDSMETRLEDFYGGGVINDTDTPADAFSIYELSEEDRRRGLFMMIYDQPPQFDMKEFFRPLASLEVQYGIDEADMLLSTLARVGNFAMEPLRVHAFFKRTPQGLKLDWEIFAQTKYRTLQNFVELPEAGHTGTFRVFIVEDVPDKSHLEAGARTYRIADPANTGDTARVNVKVDSETGRALSIINWRGTKESHPITRTATVELKWSGEASSPELEISRFICWEFLGLGGQDPMATASTK